MIAVIIDCDLAKVTHSFAIKLGKQCKPRVFNTRYYDSLRATAR